MYGTFYNLQWLATIVSSLKQVYSFSMKGYLTALFISNLMFVFIGKYSQNRVVVILPLVRVESLATIHRNFIPETGST